MKKITKPILFFSLLNVLSCAAPVKRGEGDFDQEPVKTLTQVPVATDAMPDLLKRIWILPFQKPERPVDGVNAKRLIDSLYRKLLSAFPGEKSPYFVQTSEDEESFRSSGINEMNDPKMVAKALKGSDIAGFLFGKISKIEMKGSSGDSEGLLRRKRYQIRITVDVELFDTAGGKKVGATTLSHDYVETRSEVLGLGDDEGIQDPTERIVTILSGLSERIVSWSRSLAPKLAWYGRVLRIDGGRVYLSAGRRTGLMVGDVLKVLESPRDIVDPQSGAFMGQAPGRMKGTIKVVQYFGADGAMAILQSGANILPDDRVELY